MSSANSTNLPEKETGPNTPETLPLRMTYAKVASRNRESLMHHEVTTKEVISNSNTTKAERIVHTNVFRGGGSPASVSSIFFDVSSRGERLPEVLALISKAYPNNCGGDTHKTGPRVLVELYLATAPEIETALQQGVIFEDGMRIIPCRAMSSDVDIARIRLTSLPRMPIPRSFDWP
ncbi:predicted protein [Lichtheimia corymbifera JMRC:FSU:9682]|uniref:Uncharacterized protein n=1 Tax=Lichtheimia corymbifera JMRC:FSU:9682 TaxID=1263082 RepID=A0A068SGB1_9FUNG|nr:predicted protein [Lichtheimia corymbifera JMRC:FSU:9682]